MLMKSDDDDGYCSRSSIDSPIQISKLDCIHFSEIYPIQTEVIEETASTETHLSNFSTLIEDNKESYMAHDFYYSDHNDVFKDVLNNKPTYSLTSKSNLINKNLCHSNNKFIPTLDYITSQSVLRTDLHLASFKNNVNSKKLLVSPSSNSINHATIAFNNSTNVVPSSSSNVKLQSVILPSNRNFNKCDNKVNLNIYNEVIGSSMSKLYNHVKRLPNYQQNAPLYNVHPVVEHDYCEFSSFNAEIQSGILQLSTETCLRTDKQNSRKLKTSKLLNNIAKSSIQNKNLKFENDKGKSDSFIVPLGRPRHLKASKPKKELNIDKINGKLQQNVHNEFVYYATPVPCLNKRKSQPFIKKEDISKNLIHQEPIMNEVISSEDISKTYADMNESDVVNLILDMMPKLMDYHNIIKVKSATLPIKISQRIVDVTGSLENIEFNLMAEEISNIFNTFNNVELKKLENSYTNEHTDFENVILDSTSNITNDSSKINMNFGKHEESFSDKIVYNESIDRLHSLSICTEACPPVLIIVKLFWNEMPGLKIDNQEFVRLIDIHKQILPSKDTGILKRRCLIMGFEFKECTDMERDFLIRYATAAPSKSKVIVSKKTATSLIEFYAGDRLRENYLKLRREKALNTFQNRQNMRRNSINTINDENGVKRSARLHDKRLLSINFKIPSYASRFNRSKNILKENVGRKLISWDKLTQRTMSTRRFSSSIGLKNSQVDCLVDKNELYHEFLDQKYILEQSDFNPLKFSIKIPDLQNEKLEDKINLENTNLLIDLKLNDKVALQTKEKNITNLSLNRKRKSSDSELKFSVNNVEKRLLRSTLNNKLDSLSNESYKEQPHTNLCVKVKKIDGILETYIDKDDTVSDVSQRLDNVPIQLRSKKYLNRIKTDNNKFIIKDKKIVNDFKILKHINTKILGSKNSYYKSKFRTRNNVGRLQHKKYKSCIRTDQSKLSNSNVIYAAMNRPHRTSYKKFDNLKF